MNQGKYESVKIIDDIESQTINERVINLRQSKTTDYFNWNVARIFVINLIFHSDIVHKVN